MSFAAFGPGGELLGQIGPFSLVQSGTTGQTAEDRFFGVQNAGASLPVASTFLALPNVPNGIYDVRVRAVGGGGTSGASNEAFVAVPSGPGCAAAPNTPTNFTANASGNNVFLAWSAPVGGCPATGYVVQAGSAPGLSNIAIVNVGGARSVSAFALSGTYYIRVIALNSFGISNPTTEAVLTVGSPP